ncbi:MAG: hypothetical protein RL701_357, partial [Pseudomonadota bacterium]
MSFYHAYVGFFTTYTPRICLAAFVLSACTSGSAETSGKALAAAAEGADPAKPAPTQAKPPEVAPAQPVETALHAATQAASAAEPAPLSNTDLIALLTDPAILTD